MQELGSIAPWAQFGLSGVIIYYFVRRDMRRDEEIKERERAMTTRIQKLEDYVEGELQQLVRSGMRLMQAFVDRTRILPCLVHQEDEKEETHV